MPFLANNLYGTAQCFPLPERDFTWLSKSEILQKDWKNIDTNGDIGYFVECSLHYPMSIREQTKDFPLCAENKNITYDMLSPCQKEFLRNLHGKRNYNQKKLTATFLDRKKM